MGSPDRPVTGLDILPRTVLIHPGLVFAGHLDVPRLRQSASQVVDVYPELNVFVKSSWFTLGKWHTPAAKDPAWDFKHRDMSDKTLADVFNPAAKAEEIDMDSSSKITPLGAVETVDVQNLFGFEGPPAGSIGSSPIPTLSFRVTTLGSKENGHTLLNMMIPHFITDAMGAGGLIETWGRLYNGEAIPARTEDAHPDLVKLLDAVPLGDRGRAIKEDEQPGLGLRSGFFDFLSYAKDLWRLTSKGCEEHYVHFPRRLLEKYRGEARAQLQQDNRSPSVSSHDVFSAMMLKLYAHSSLVLDENQPFDFYYVYSMSPAFPKRSLPDPYLHNINTPGWFPLPSTSAITSASLPELAIIIRKRLNALRTVNNVRETLLHQERMASTLMQIPRVDGKHGWGMVSSWRGVEENASKGFAGEKLLFLRPATENPGGLVAPNITFPVGDGHGGLIARVALVKGDWDRMWANSGLANLE